MKTINLYCTNPECRMSKSPLVEDRTKWNENKGTLTCATCNELLTSVQGNVQQTYYELCKEWEHPLKKFEVGCLYTAGIWCSYIGCELTQEEFVKKYNKGEFEGWFEKVIELGPL